jgi:hypothetical protein
MDEFTKFKKEKGKEEFAKEGIVVDDIMILSETYESEFCKACIVEENMQMYMKVIFDVKKVRERFAEKQISHITSYIPILPMVMVMGDKEKKE